MIKLDVTKLKFEVLPWSQGQMIELAYASVGRRVVRRRADAGDRTIEFDWGWASDRPGPHCSPGIRGTWKPLVADGPFLVAGASQ